MEDLIKFDIKGSKGVKEVGLEEFHKFQGDAFKKDIETASRLIWTAVTCRPFVCAIAVGYMKDHRDDWSKIVPFLRQVLGITHPSGKYASALHNILAGKGEFDADMKSLAKYRPTTREIDFIMAKLRELVDQKTCAVYFVLPRLKLQEKEFEIRIAGTRMAIVGS